MTHLKKSKPRKKTQSFRIPHELLHEINTIERERKNEFKTQTAVIIALLELGLLEEFERQSNPRARMPDKKTECLQSNDSSKIAVPFSYLLLPSPDTQADADFEPHQLSIRLPIELLNRIKLLAEQRQAKIHHTSNKVTLSPSILHLLKLGLTWLEKYPVISSVAFILQLITKRNSELADRQKCITENIRQNDLTKMHDKNMVQKT